MESAENLRNNSVMKSCSCCGAQYSDDVQVCPQDQTPLREPDIGKPAPAKVGAVCPGCGAVDDCSLTVRPDSSFNLGAFLLGGILAVIFRNAGQRTRVRCNKCETGFYIRTPCSGLWLFIYWLLIGPTLIGLAILLIEFVVKMVSR
jgi:hypothetical protein